MNENKNSFLIFILYFEYVILYKNIIEMCVMIEENFVLIFSYNYSVMFLIDIVYIR